MKKVEWNKDHTWKITKNYKNDELISFYFYGEIFESIADFSGVDTDDYGNEYISGDTCGNCELKHFCFADNPINNACNDMDGLCKRLGVKHKYKSRSKFIFKKKYGIIDN